MVHQFVFQTRQTAAVVVGSEEEDSLTASWEEKERESANHLQEIAFATTSNIDCTKHKEPISTGCFKAAGALQG